LFKSWLGNSNNPIIKYILPGTVFQIAYHCKTILESTLTYYSRELIMAVIFIMQAPDE